MRSLPPGCASSVKTDKPFFSEEIAQDLNVFEARVAEDPGRIGPERLVDLHDPRSAFPQEAQGYVSQVIKIPQNIRQLIFLQFLFRHREILRLQFMLIRISSQCICYN